MLHRMVLAVGALAISAAAGAAEHEPKKEECPTFNHEAIEDMLRHAPSCRRAVTLFEICEYGAGGDVTLGMAVTKKCEGDFLGKLSVAQKRAYDRKQKHCARKYQNEEGTMYRSFEAFCGAYVARDYSAKFLKVAPARRK